MKGRCQLHRFRTHADDRTRCTVASQPREKTSWQRELVTTDRMRSAGLFPHRGLLAAAMLSYLSVSGCMGDVRDDREIAARRTEYAWAVPSHRRVAMWFFPWIYSFNRDTFMAVRSDGHRLVAATAAQNSDSHPHDTYLYGVDGTSGELLFVVPAITSDEFCVRDGYVVLIGDAKYDPSKRYPIEVRRFPDGQIVFQTDTAQVGMSFVLCPGIAGQLLRLHNPREPDVFLDVTSGDPVPAAQAEKRIETLVSQGLLDAQDPWRLVEMETMYPREARCGDVTVRIGDLARGIGQSWLMATHAPCATQNAPAQ